MFTTATNYNSLQYQYTNRLDIRILLAHQIPSVSFWV